MRLVVQVPCLNEEETLPAVLSTIPRSIPGIDEILILIIDDGEINRRILQVQALRWGMQPHEVASGPAALEVGRLLAPGVPASPTPRHAYLASFVDASGAVKRTKYQELSTNVSIVSVSRRAGLPHFGHEHSRNRACLFSGLPLPSGTQSSGSTTGSWSSGTGTAPQASQCTIGIGQPQ